MMCPICGFGVLDRSCFAMHWVGCFGSVPILYVLFSRPVFNLKGYLS